MLEIAKWLFLTMAVSLVALQSYGQNNLLLQNDNGQGRGLLDWIGFGTGPETDPYVAKTNAGCLGGDLAECFKSHAISSFVEFFEKPQYQINDNARIVRMPEGQLRQLAREPYEYSQSPRSDEPEWDQLVKFAMRKVEKFLKSTAIEVDFSNDVTERGRYTPRVLDEISEEIDVLEDKRDTLFNRKKLKKLFIPLLIILKLFKLKLLLFLPLILGLSSLKNLLGFFAIVIPGLIAFFKLCKPNISNPFGQSSHYPPQYTPAGIGYNPYYKDHSGYANEYSENYYEEPGRKFSFGNGERAQETAYSGYSHYRNKNGNIEAEDARSAPKKSILPDS